MFDIDKWQEIWHSLTKHKLRTLLTAFGVFWGIFMLIILLGAGKGLENAVLDMFSSYANNYFYMGSNKTSIVHNGLNINRVIEPNIEDLNFFQNHFPEIEYISPKQAADGENTITHNSKSGIYSVQGIYPEWRLMEKTKVIEGRYIDRLDLAERKNVAVIGRKVKEYFFDSTQNVIGKYINVKGVYFKVIGVTEPLEQGWRARQELETIWIPYSTIKVFNQTNKVFYWACSVKAGYDVEATTKKIRSYFAKKYNFDETDEVAIWTWSMSKEAAKFQGLFSAIGMFVWVVGFGTIIAGIVGVSNIMLIIVKERTKEIGIRKALGATPGSIISLIIQESIVLTTVAGYTGLIVGVGLIEGLNYILLKNNVQSDFFKNPEVKFSVAISAVILLVITGTLAGLIPAIRAAKISPIEALKDE